MLWIEGIVALVFMLAFLVHAFFAFKPEHVEHHPERVRIGAAIQGLTIGLFVGFVVVPLRMGYMDFRGFDPGDFAGDVVALVLAGAWDADRDSARRVAEGAGAFALSARVSPRLAAEGA
ncbi:MAG: hypothetical protein IPG56_11925 [Caulobacteraceae bacterium]|nr:hypothetical protein [Caulobacteraceae bacterium]